MTPDIGMITRFPTDSGGLRPSYFAFGLQIEFAVYMHERSSALGIVDAIGIVDVSRPFHALSRKAGFERY